MQISEAYKKINSVMEGSDGESREVAAFMRMFMDMVGISDSDSIPAGIQSKKNSFLNISYGNFYFFFSYDFRYDVWSPSSCNGRVEHR